MYRCLAALLLAPSIAFAQENVASPACQERLSAARRQIDDVLSKAVAAKTITEDRKKQFEQSQQIQSNQIMGYSKDCAVHMNWVEGRKREAATLAEGREPGMPAARPIGTPEQRRACLETRDKTLQAVKQEWSVSGATAEERRQHAARVEDYLKSAIPDGSNCEFTLRQLKRERELLAEILRNRVPPALERCVAEVREVHSQYWSQHSKARDRKVLGPGQLVATASWLEKVESRYPSAQYSRWPGGDVETCRLALEGARTAKKDFDERVRQCEINPAICH